ncbi:MAG TPA: ABC transporter ATP-binding protein [Vicinamibacterales bacterium]
MTILVPAVEVDALRHRYGTRVALDGVSFVVPGGQIFGLLGPNGGGKTTLFKIVSTLLAPSEGTVRVFGDDVVRDPAAVRRRLGVVFQHPALDARLTVEENLRHQGHLYGLSGRPLGERIVDVLSRVRLGDRRRDLVGTLSGGLQRRAEVAKALLHRPQLLVLDEPSTGLDPSARREISQDLSELRRQEGTSVILTTHLMEEAAGCDRVAILDRGLLVALDTPVALTAAIGGDVVLVTTRDAKNLAERVGRRFTVKAEVVDGKVRIERDRAHEFITDLVESFPGEIDAVAFGKPTLEDVFVHYTGRRLEEAAQ